ncbi:MAG TPA: flagellar biosynthetic protein FliO [Candidatus Cybelea sp.]
MSASFWAVYAIKLAVVAVVLAALYALARALRASRFLFSGAQRHLDVIESAMLTPQSAVHLVRVGKRYLFLGGGAAGLRKLAELEPGELEIKPRST